MQDMAVGRPVPGGGGQPGLQSERHQLMIGGMKGHLVDAAAVAVVGVQHRRHAVGLHAPVDDLGRAAAGAQGGQPRLMLRPAAAAHGVQQRPVAGEQVDVLQRRRLVGHLVGVQIGDGTEGRHGRAPFRLGAEHGTGVARLRASPLPMGEGLSLQERSDWNRRKGEGSPAIVGVSRPTAANAD
ncbi:hypothetical protein D3C86_1432060 [compost metagenome]